MRQRHRNIPTLWAKS